MIQEQVPQKFNYYTRTIILVILVLLSVSGYTIWRHTARKPPKFEEVLMCEKCGHIFALEHTVDELPPYICAKCGQKTAYKAYICGRCGPFPVKFTSSGSDISCPKCLSQEYVKELIYPPINEPVIEKKKEK